MIQLQFCAKIIILKFSQKFRRTIRDGKLFITRAKFKFEHGKRIESAGRGVGVPDPKLSAGTKFLVIIYFLNYCMELIYLHYLLMFPNGLTRSVQCLFVAAYANIEFSWTRVFKVRTLVHCNQWQRFAISCS
jgi:hypothetical protein